MRFHEEASRDAYDVVVVGGGLGGLTAGALLARQGRRVLVVERHDRPGGYAHAFRRKGNRFDSSVHLVGGCEPVPFEGGALLHRVLEALGVRKLCTFARVEPVYRIEWPGFVLAPPSGVEAFVEAHSERFPREAAGIRGFVEDCLKIRAEASLAEESVGDRSAAGRKRFPLLVRYRRATLRQVLEERIRNERARAALACLWPYLGLPPSRVSFLYFASMLMSYVADGAYSCRGTFQSLANALVVALKRNGGELLLRSVVRRIRVEGGRVTGVVLENGQCVRTPLVISNADVRQTVEELAGGEHFPERFRRRLRVAKPSISGFVVYAAARLDPAAADLAYETFVYDGADHEAAYDSCLRGRSNWLSITAPSWTDPAVAAGEHHLFVLTTLVGAAAESSWKRAKPRLQAELLARAERRLPGLSDRLLFAEAATPRTMERYTRNREGALYGFEVSPSQIGSSRVDNRTPLRGLYLAGHWTRPGGGVTGVVGSGLRAARLVLADAGEGSLTL